MGKILPRERFCVNVLELKWFELDTVLETGIFQYYVHALSPTGEFDSLILKLTAP